MSSFADLMALSQTQTRRSEAAVQSALADKKRKDAAKQKAQEAKEKREREIEAVLRKKHLEDMEREKERQQRDAQERARKDREMERREAEQRDALRYGPKRSKSEYPAKKSGGGRAYDSDDSSGGGLALTREEKRKRRMELEMRHGAGSGRRPGPSGYRRPGRRLPGGAIDSVDKGEGGTGNYRSIKEKLTAAPVGLMKLGLVKRDVRTIDEIHEAVRNRKDHSVLQGENAKEFADWFGRGKNKAKAKYDGQSQSQSQSQSRAQSRASSVFGSPPPKVSRGSSLDFDFESESKHTASIPSTQKTTSASSTPPVQSRPKPVSTESSSTSKLIGVDKPPARGSSIFIKAVGGRPGSDRSVTTPKSAFTKPNGTAKAIPSSSSKTSTSRPIAASSKSASSIPPVKKRPRSPSFSLSPPPAKRRPPTQASSSISNAIWAMFGKDRNSYISKEVLSDDDDMEADARDLEQEELRSARIARREEAIALEEERRHEEEKRRKRKEKR